MGEPLIHAVLAERPFLRKGCLRKRPGRWPGAFTNPGPHAQPGHLVAVCGTLKYNDIGDARATTAYRKINCPACLVVLDWGIERGVVDVVEAPDGSARLRLIGTMPGPGVDTLALISEVRP